MEFRARGCKGLARRGDKAAEQNKIALGGDLPLKLEDSPLDELEAVADEGELFVRHGIRAWSQVWYGGALSRGVWRHAAVPAQPLLSIHPHG